MQNPSLLAVASPPAPVRCVNCADTASRWLAVAAVIVAVLSFAGTLWMLSMARREHREFVATLNRRVKLVVTPGLATLEQQPDGRTLVVVQVGLNNVGDKVATRVGLNLLAPSWAEDFQWSDEAGQAISVGSPGTTSEILTASDGASHEAQYRYLELPYVGLSSSHYVKFARLHAPREHRLIPLRAFVWGDDITPETHDLNDDGNIVVDYEVAVPDSVPVSEQ